MLRFSLATAPMSFCALSASAKRVSADHLVPNSHCVRSHRATVYQSSICLSNVPLHQSSISSGWTPIASMFTFIRWRRINVF